MGVVVSKERCPECAKENADQSGNNLVIYDDGSNFCFRCYKPISSESHKVIYPQDFCYGVHKNLTERKITHDICEWFDYSVGINKEGKRYEVANYKDSLGDVKMQSVRLANKQFFYTLDTKSQLLFGSWRYQPNEKLMIVVTEGEIDAMSVAQVQGKQYPVVSVPRGAGNAKRAILANEQYLLGFKHIVLMLDNDEAGHKATSEICSILPPHKLRIARLPLKDANDMLKAGRVQELKDAIWNAKQYQPDFILRIDKLIDEYKEPEQTLWPWLGLNELLGGVEMGTHYMIGSGSGCGKTTFITQTLKKLIQQDNKVHVIQIEGQDLDIAQSLIGEDIDRETANRLVTFHNGQEGYDADLVISRIRYVAKYLGVKYILLDNITGLYILNNMDVGKISKLVCDLQLLCKELGITIFSVCHLAKPMGDNTFENGRKIFPSDFRGSQAMQYFSGAMIAIERNKFSSDLEFRNMIKVIPIKIRRKAYSKNECVPVYMKYDHDTEELKQISESEYTEAKNRANSEDELKELLNGG